MKKLESYQTEGITVTFDPNRCIHSAQCLRRLPSVFRTQERRWIQPEHAPTAEVVAAVGRCPSGALQVVPSELAEPVGEALVQAVANGPYYVRGPIVLETSAGPIELNRAALCRCGQTNNAPFCDRSHLRAGFTAP